MKKISKHLFLLLIPMAVMLGSCRNPEADFKMSLAQKCADKYIDESELSGLDGQLAKAMKKNRQGVKLGTDVIKNHESLIDYLVTKKECEVTGMEAAREVKFENLYILLENSVSMQGYVGDGNPDFAEPIIALLQCDAGLKHTAYAGATGNSNPRVNFQFIPQDDFLQNITQGRFISSVASPLDKMIDAAVEMIVEEAVDSVDVADDIVVNNVFCLITDGLLSGTNSEIAGNREFTKHSLPLLEDRIRTAVEKADNYGLHCLVYRLIAPFSGTYYDYRNIKHLGFVGPRPYYMLMIGDKVNLEKIEGTLAKETNFTKHPSQRFASYDVTSNKTLTKATIAHEIGQTAITASGKSIKYNPAKLKVDPVVFTIKMQLKEIPSYYLDTNSLYRNLVLRYHDAPSKLDVTIPVESWLQDITFDEDTKTYVFTVQIDNDYLKKMVANQTPIHFLLPGRQDGWYRELSVSDDTTIANGDTSTFGLDRFMGGIMKGFGYQDATNIPDAISVKLTLEKTK